MRSRVAVYGGSFNPLHIGHLAILKTLAGLYDRVLLVVTPKNPLKDTISAEGSLERLEAARQAVRRHPELAGKVEVSDIEFTLKTPNYTINTLDALAAENPILVIGGDQFADIRRWRLYKKILRVYGVAVYPREGFDSQAIKKDLKKENKNYKIYILQAPELTISSTEIREGLAAGKDMSKWLM